ncbi:carboxymuconolactone decarboxylase family protein [Nonomuraea sp. NPDC050663]|uniref:carboxymuconolactone decarboxylase family protein n=1 Tax=Nonomuraea sp. NPDC050663 TaxID=3364370 RepID=UPI00379CD4A7
MEPRVEPLPPAERTGFAAKNPLNVFTTLARHPKLFEAWLGFGGALLYGTLPARDRELAILRTARNRACAYEWAHHLRLAREAGLSEEEISAVRHDGSGLTPGDLLILRAADELHADGDLTDETWSALCERYDETGRIELVMLIAHYDMLSRVLTTFRVQLER